MNRARLFVPVLAAAAFLSGCATTGGEGQQVGSNPIAGWSEETREVAQRSWLYAQLSSNTYIDPTEEFILPGDIVLRHVQPNDGRGYAYAIYDRFEGQAHAETIIAYRGTEPALDDWILGNVFGLQNEPGLETARVVSGQLDAPEHADVDLSVTGHSLGGGIAHFVSLHALDEAGEGVTRSVVFNNSPRFSGYDRDADRLAVVERGDWLASLRAIGSEPDQLYQSLNCQPGFSPFRDHSIRRLADCLTWIAALDDEQARLSLAQNPLVVRPQSQSSEVRPPQAADLRGAGIPINPYISGFDWIHALDASLRLSTVLAPLYDIRAGFRLEVVAGEEAGQMDARWILNGRQQASFSHDCEGVSIEECTAAIVKAGEELVPRPRF